MNEATKSDGGYRGVNNGFYFRGVVIGLILFENVIGPQIQGIEAVALKMFLVKHCDQEKLKLSGHTIAR